ncbi:MAG: SlyX family protein [Desulfuromonadales bacterium]
MDELTERVMELEIRYAYQNRLLDEFNQIIIENNHRLDALERENRVLREMLRSLAPATDESPDE